MFLPRSLEALKVGKPDKKLTLKGMKGNEMIDVAAQAFIAFMTLEGFVFNSERRSSDENCWFSCKPSITCLNI